MHNNQFISIEVKNKEPFTHFALLLAEKELEKKLSVVSVHWCILKSSTIGQTFTGNFYGES